MFSPTIQRMLGLPVEALAESGCLAERPDVSPKNSIGRMNRIMVGGNV
jgi:hypothetical protein